MRSWLQPLALLVVAPRQPGHVVNEWAWLCVSIKLYFQKQAVGRTGPAPLVFKDTLGMP